MKLTPGGTGFEITIEAAKSDGSWNRREEDEDNGGDAHQAERVRDVAPVQWESSLDLKYKFSKQPFVTSTSKKLDHFT
jgi:hypothetical protein